MNSIEFAEQRGASKIYFAVGKSNEEWFKSYKKLFRVVGCTHVDKNERVNLVTAPQDTVVFEY